jgi:hypothetical protein
MKETYEIETRIALEADWFLWRLRTRLKHLHAGV